MSGPITRSRASSSFGKSVDHTSVGMTEHTELMGKLSELLDAIEKSTRTNQQSKEQIAESTEKGIRSQTDFLTLQEQHQTQLATLLSQNSLQVGPALQPTPFFGKPTDDLVAFLSHFEMGGMLNNVYGSYHFTYRVILVHGMLVSILALIVMMI